MVEQLDVTLEGLRQLRRRIDRQKLETADWAIVGALVSKLIARTEGRHQRMLAKLAAAAAQNSVGATDPVGNAEESEHSGSTSDTDRTDDHGSSAPGSPNAEPSGGASGPGDGPKPKEKPPGHGRNGAGAYVNAKHLFHALVGVVGLLCEACGVGRMLRYREKLLVRVLGQSLFGAEIHHFEQLRCRLCGWIIRAAGPAFVDHGIGSSYVIYDWSACAMLTVMHYFGGAPFKRLESLHQGWGVPLADANQWTVVDKSHDLLLPLYRAIERYGIQKAQRPADR